jgi:hypothetical protein
MVEDVEYRKRLDLAKTYLLDEVLKDYRDASFVDIEDHLKGRGFFKDVDKKEEGLTNMGFPGNPHLVIWSTDNQFVIDTAKELWDEKKISFQPVEAIKYAMDGRIPPMESITSESLGRVMKPDYVFQEDEEYWVPIVVNIKKNSKE